jgi:hypothetical protein
MIRLARRRHTLTVVRPRRPHLDRTLRYTLRLTTTILLAFLLWPYVVLWRVDQAASQADPAALAPFVDLPAVRSAIMRKLNKDADSAIGPLSDPFIRWLEAGIAADGSDAIEHLVTLDWVRGRLLANSAGHQDGFLSDVSYAFFDAPNGFRVRIGPATGYPTRVRLRLRDLHWRVTAVYY